jgi:hypothetical protein
MRGSDYARRAGGTEVPHYFFHEGTEQTETTKLALFTGILRGLRVLRLFVMRRSDYARRAGGTEVPHYFFFVSS